MNQNGSQIHSDGNGHSDDTDTPGVSAGQVSVNTAGVDDLLDEIDGLLESNAEEFVRSYVQKGGQ
ncbi:ubiquitin-like protein Pup [Corynebacterium diphtheriae]|uniref:Prokaryotic ubiquitin-like protein Pup n=2 Tax=Corynebacterium diphtheriae TaxID=1717 RepID=PUP_CORDI|nr:ubiquitin-like protein Pup [Corynebacterium diphtheriae]Q6NH94.1 RecName: Full=Prokaryotic ubiquitin-like protein Pup; AltName: Full=Bacterial ubiquitin-like modifier [Corynebacterium diphtheriae NCTC 13129]ARB87406.1 prokaryotic ubiquitin-like protein Pup [Corynebacterium diphtheriae]KKA80827.1 ubiquitin [Corynebacterium diphtheriae]MBG9227458.1 ubiquitin-like protein Pup [Corynebacterium diphtheriae bv. gravis]MBG9250621.1 ubiquitin-like protein Pup [Corynebacterium diphtheriae bv. mitis]